MERMFGLETETLEKQLRKFASLWNSISHAGRLFQRLLLFFFVQRARALQPRANFCDTYPDEVRRCLILDALS